MITTHHNFTSVSTLLKLIIWSLRYECLKSKKCKILKSALLYDALLSQGEISKGKRQIIVIKKKNTLVFIEEIEITPWQYGPLL